jgi:hypothetical protein
MTTLRYSMLISARAAGVALGSCWVGDQKQPGMNGVTVHRVTAVISRIGLATAISPEEAQAGDRPLSAKHGSRSILLFTNTEKQEGRRHPPPLPFQTHDGLAATACHEVVWRTRLLRGHLVVGRSLRDPVEA